MRTKFYQNRLGFIEDMTKIFWCVLFGSQGSYHIKYCNVNFVAYRALLLKLLPFQSPLLL